MFAEIKMGMAERGNAKQETDVVQLNGEVLDVATETSRYVVSIRFTGLIREEKDAPAAPFDEIWHMTKPDRQQPRLGAGRNPAGPVSTGP